MAEQQQQQQQQQLIQILRDVQAAASNVRTAIPGVESKIAPTSSGLSLLEVKNHCLVSYLTALVHLLAAKLNGQDPSSWASLDTLIEARVLLEKIKPMEVKLKYRIDKLLKQVDVAGSKAASEHDALSFKPNVANLAATAAADADDDDAENDEDDEDEFSINPMDPAGRSKAGAATAIYRPPRISATPYQDGATTSRRAAKLAATASRSRLLRELEDELGDAPESRSATLTDASARTEEIDAHFAERARYEEDNFLRVNYTKQDKKLRKQRDRVANMGDEMRGLMADFEDEEAKPAKPRGPPGAKKRVRNDDAAESGRNHVDEMLGFLENKRAKRKKTALYDGGGNDDGPLTDGSGALSAEFQKARKSAGKKLRGEANKDMRRAQRAQFE